MTSGTRAPTARRAGWMLTGVLATLTLIAGLLLPATAASAVSVPNWAHLYLDDPVRPIGEPYIPPNQNSSTGALSTVTRKDTGVYVIRFVDVATSADQQGAIQVSSAQTNTVCQLRGSFHLIDSAVPGHLDAVVEVGCRLPNGNFSNAMLNAFWTFAGGNLPSGPGVYGYVIADEPTNGGYTPPFGYTSAGTAPFIARQGTGRWSVEFTGEGFAASGGTVQVVSHGFNADPAVRCHPGSWGASGPTTLRIDVDCYSTATNAPVDSLFMLTYTRDRSLFGDWGVIPYGYARSDAPPGSQYNTPGATVTRLGRGTYDVSFPVPGVPGPFAVQVTVIEPAMYICSAVGWNWLDGEAKGRVTCRTPGGGSSADATFTVAFTGT